MGFEPINERICKIGIQGKYHNTTLINIHAPTEKKMMMSRKSFTQNYNKYRRKYQNTIC